MSSSRRRPPGRTSPSRTGRPPSTQHCPPGSPGGVQARVRRRPARPRHPTRGRRAHRRRRAATRRDGPKDVHDRGPSTAPDSTVRRPDRDSHAWMSYCAMPNGCSVRGGPRSVAELRPRAIIDERSPPVGTTIVGGCLAVGDDTRERVEEPVDVVSRGTRSEACPQAVGTRGDTIEERVGAEPPHPHRDAVLCPEGSRDQADRAALELELELGFSSIRSRGVYSRSQVASPRSEVRP